MSKHKVCELHFEEECISRHFEPVCKDGERVLIERERPILIKGSIPTKFPNCPKYLSKKGTKRKAPIDRSAVANKKKKSSSISEVQVDAANLHTDNISYDALLLDVCNIHMPSNWKKDISGQEMVFIKLNPSYQCERHVVITQDLAIKVRFLYIYSFSFCIFSTFH